MIWSGYLGSNGYQYLNAHGYLWSTTVYGYQVSYGLDMITSGRMGPQGGNSKVNGFPLRCLALQPHRQHRPSLASSRRWYRY